MHVLGSVLCLFRQQMLIAISVGSGSYKMLPLFPLLAPVTLAMILQL